MQFKHPELLYALILLIIPIIIHLFQLQKFKKVAFTNVAFLKKIEQQTRKSSKLKKWLILLTRLLAFTCLIIAFAQPYFSNNSINQNYHTNIYLDNSFSMQAKGENGELLKSIAQEIIENIHGENTNFSLITNDQEFNNIDALTLKNELKKVDYSSTNLNLSTVVLGLNNQNSTETNHSNKNILISDFQTINSGYKTLFTNVTNPIQLVKATPIKPSNIYIDSIYFSNPSTTEITLNVLSSSVKKTTINVPISLYNDAVLIGKAVVKFTESNKATTQFTIANPSEFKGKLVLNNDDLSFDDTFYFHLEKAEKINILSIGETADFIKKIYTEDEFNLTVSPLQNLNYSALQKQHVILLNSIENVPEELATALNEFTDLGGNLVIIPAENATIASYTTLFKTLSIGTILGKTELEQKVTSINFNHPLLKNVFEKEVQNFEYPTVKNTFKTSLVNSDAILKFASNEAFISSITPSKGTIFWIAAPLDINSSNFIQSSLVVPIFYNFGKNSLKIAEPYYSIQPETILEIGTQIGKDQVLTISNETSDFIPLQEISQNKVTITIENNNLQSGFYTIKNGDIPLKTIAFNYNRKESDLNYTSLEPLIESNKAITLASSIGNLFDNYYSEQKINWLFKWFLAFSILFLLIEMLILKYFKT